MAGTTALISTNSDRSFPDIFQYVSVTINSDTEDLTQTKSSYIMYCEVDTVVDAAYLTFSDDDGSNDATFRLDSLVAGTAPVTGGTAITNAATTGTTDASTVTWTVDETANIVPAGNRIGLKVTGTSTAEGINVTLRIRTRIG
tara:strand:+ start:727 stop:1155 length:429 start_codon:yes stop_codon:yes gene_type:complete